MIVKLRKRKIKMKMKKNRLWRRFLCFMGWHSIKITEQENNPRYDSCIVCSRMIEYNHFDVLVRRDKKKVKRWWSIKL